MAALEPVEGGGEAERFEAVPPSRANWERAHEIQREMDEASNFLESFAENADELVEELRMNTARLYAWLDQVEAHLRETRARWAREEEKKQRKSEEPPE